MSQARVRRAVINFDLNVTFMGCGNLTRERRKSNKKLSDDVIKCFSKDFNRL